MRLVRLAVFASASILVAAPVTTGKAVAQTAAPAPIEEPAKTIPVPTTVSPQLQKIIGEPHRRASAAELEYPAQDRRGVEAGGGRGRGGADQERAGHAGAAQGQGRKDHH